MDFSKIAELAKKYEPDMTRFLRDMIKIPSESCGEKEVVLRIKEEMEKVGFDGVEIDEMGNNLFTNLPNINKVIFEGGAINLGSNTFSGISATA